MMAARSSVRYYSMPRGSEFSSIAAGRPNACFVTIGTDSGPSFSDLGGIVGLLHYYP